LAANVSVSTVYICQVTASIPVAIASPGLGRQGPGDQDPISLEREVLRGGSRRDPTHFQELLRVPELDGPIAAGAGDQGVMLVDCQRPDEVDVRLDRLASLPA